jgi:hypothetical protein
MVNDATGSLRASASTTAPAIAKVVPFPPITETEKAAVSSSTVRLCVAARQRPRLRREDADAGQDAERGGPARPAAQPRRVLGGEPAPEQQREEGEARAAQGARVVGGAQRHGRRRVARLAAPEQGRDHRAPPSTRKRTAPPPTWPSADRPRYSIR